MNYQFEDASIIYAGDPLCSWCWGMAEELTSFKESNQIPFHTIVGGLRPGTTNQITDEERAMIRHHWVEVNKRTGQPINFDLMDKKIPFVYDTEIPCRAVATVRKISPQKSLPFFKLIQRAFYVENKDTNEEEFYKDLIEIVGLDYEEFIQRFNSEEMRKETNDDFMWCRNVGANSFPTVILKHDQQLFALATGYASQSDMEQRMQDIVNKK